MVYMVVYTILHDHVHGHNPVHVQVIQLHEIVCMHNMYANLYWHTQKNMHPDFQFFKPWFPSQSAPKVLLDPNKDFIFIMELYKLSEQSARSSLQSKTQTLHVWYNYFKLALKNYIGNMVCHIPWEFHGKIQKIH